MTNVYFQKLQEPYMGSIYLPRKEKVIFERSAGTFFASHR